MAAKVETAEQEQQKNTIDAERLKKEIARIEEALDAKLSHKMRYVESCKPVNERVANAYEIASKAAGVPLKVLKATIKQRDLQRKIEAVPEKFEDETRETFDMVCQALGDFGDLPLGRAVKERAAQAEGKFVPSTNQQKKPRGRPRKHAAAEPDVVQDGEKSSGLGRLDPRAVAETDDPTYQRGHKHGMAGGGCVIPSELSGLFRDRWHAGWHAGNAVANAAAENPPRNDADRERDIADARAAEENAKRLGAGITPLH